MVKKIFIDGEAGTTGLQIRDRLKGRLDIQLLSLGEDLRKDENARRELLNSVDVAILCLPDAAARLAVDLIDNENVQVIDASSAHRTTPGWVYGMPEYANGQRDLIKNATRVTNPGCYAISSVGMIHPLVTSGIIDENWPVTINAVSGYSGGGRQLIERFENKSIDDYTDTPFRVYGLGLDHKHIPEIKMHGGLNHAPLMVPSVGRFKQGMIVQLPLPLWSMAGNPSASDVAKILSDHYKNEKFVAVLNAEETQNISHLDPEILNGSNELRLHVFSNTDGDQAVVVALLDNLGKGASGQALQNLNLMIGADEETGLF